MEDYDTRMLAVLCAWKNPVDGGWRRNALEKI
jgi:hypothetical protein